MKIPVFKRKLQLCYGEGSSHLLEYADRLIEVGKLSEENSKWRNHKLIIVAFFIRETSCIFTEV